MINDSNEASDALASAYISALQCGIENNLNSIGFCLISAGIYRGDRDLKDVIAIALNALINNIKPPISNVYLFAFTREEQICLLEVFENLISNYN